MSSAICFNLDQSKILSSSNGLTYEDSCFVVPWHKTEEFHIFRHILSSTKT